jgi:TetR/AcrR family transcriptional repressor of nem operon
VARPREFDEDVVVAAGDTAALGDLLLAIHRGTEALGRGGLDERSLRELVETALAGLPKPP